MTQQTTPTIVIERHIKAPAEKIYKAFLDPDVLARYQAPPGTEVIYENFVAKVGHSGSYTMQMGERASRFNVTFLELIEFTKIRHTYAFDMEGPMGIQMEICITFKEEGDTTLVRFEQWGLPAPIPVEGATAGWGGMMDRLKVLMEE